MVVQKKKILKKPSDKKDKPEERVVKVPAGDAINEAILIGAVLNNEKSFSKYIKVIEADDFQSAQHAAIWKGLTELNRKKLELTLPALKQIAPEVDLELLSELKSDYGEQKNVEFHAERLKWDRARVEMCRGPLAQLIEEVRELTTPPERLRALVQQCGDLLNRGATTQGLRDPEQIIREERAELTALRTGLAIYPFGIDALDYYHEHDPMPPHAESFLKHRQRVPRLVPGTLPGQFTVVTGLPGTGKSTTTARAMLTLANQGRRILYGAWEMEANLTLRIMAGMSLGWPRSVTVTGAFDEEDQEALLAEEERLAHLIRFLDIDQKSKRSKKYNNDRALDIIHQAIEDTGSDIMVADLLRRAMRKIDPEEEEQFLNGFQSIGKESKCHLIAVHQLKSKEIESTRTKKPSRNLLKGTSMWYEAPDLVLGWHCPAQWDPSLTNDKLICYIMKQRLGVWPLAVEIDYDPIYGELGEGRSIDPRDEQSSQSFGASFLS